MNKDEILSALEVAEGVGENNILKMTWSVAGKNAAARGWAGKVNLSMEVSANSKNSDNLYRFLRLGAPVLVTALRQLQEAEARAEKAEQELAALRAQQEPNEDLRCKVLEAYARARSKAAALRSEYESGHSENMDLYNEIRTLEDVADALMSVVQSNKG